MKIHYESKHLDWLPEGTVAFTFGEHVYVAGSQASWGTLLHESCHVLQFRRLGKVRFVLLFLWYSVRYGYWDNPLEVEARAFAKDRQHRFSLLQNAEYLQGL